MHVCMYECMDVCMYVCMDGWMAGWMDGWYVCCVCCVCCVCNLCQSMHICIYLPMYLCIYDYTILLEKILGQRWKIFVTMGLKCQELQPDWYIKPMAHTLVPWNHLYSVLTWGSATGTQSIPPSAWPAMPGRWQQDSGSRGGNPKLRKITKKGLHNQSGKGHSKLRPIHLRGLWRAHQSHPLLYLRAQGLWFGFIKVWLFFWAHEIG